MQKRYYNLTLSNVMATVAVIYMHVNTRVFSKASVTSVKWLTAHLMISICYYAVPVFFMISGATLIDYRDRYNTQTFFRLRIKKTVIPFIFWSLFALGFQLFTGQRELASLTPARVINGILTAEYQPNYWFFLNLFSAYLLIPIISLIPKESRKTIFAYILLVALVLEKLIPFLDSFLPLSIPKAVIMPLGTETLWFLFAGYYLQNTEFGRKERHAIYVIGLFGLCMEIFGTYYLSTKAGKLVETFRGSSSLPNLLYSVAVFVLLKQVSCKIESNRRAFKVIDFLSGYTFGIFLIHRYLLNIISIYTSTDTWRLSYRVFMPLGMILICVAVIWLIRKIPVFGKMILP